MRYCKHTQWLGLAVDDKEVLLQNTDRLQTLLEDLPEPDEQSPSLIVFIGNKSKGMAIKELAKTFTPPPRYGSDCQYQQIDRHAWTGNAKLHGRRAQGEIHLHIHAPSTFSKRPVLLAEGDFPSYDKTRSLTTESCHETSSRLMNVDNVSESTDRIYFRLLLPFTDVFCFFADDIGGLKSVVHRLALWLDLGQPSTLPSATRPKVLIVLERDEGDDESDSTAFRWMLSEETTIDVSEQFSDIQILSITTRNKALSNKARHRELFENLLNFSDQVREARIMSQTLFSAHHFAAFFHYALNHAAKTAVEPFNFIAASRVANPVATDLCDHLVEFLHDIESPQKTLHFAVPTIASSFLLDAYPPDMHFFRPSEVFSSLYKEVCHQVCRTGVLTYHETNQVILPSDFVRLLEAEFANQVEEFRYLVDVSGAMWHQKTLSKHQGDWLTLYSSKTCYMCLRATPQYRLQCRHIICDMCYRKLGKQSDLWKFEIHHCFLCHQATPGNTLEVKPPTATARLLCIDGGGVRGIIPLVVLQALEERVGLPYPVYGNFDFIFGTSAGGIIALALRKGLLVEDCIALYERVAKQAFKLHVRWSCLAILLSLFTDGIYPTRNLDRALQEVYGIRTTILDWSRATAMGIKIGVVASTMKPEPFLFTNYNALGRRDRNQKYGILQGDALVWEIARSTSAAPGFFTPKRIAGMKLQDGGLTHNNPMKLALEEIETVLHNDPSAKRSTLKVSLGTGKAARHSPEMYGSSSWWRDLWLFRLLRALWSSIEGQENDVRREDTSSSEKESKIGTSRRRGEYFRFSLEFHSRQPRLDDSSKVPEIKTLAQEATIGSEQIDRLAHCLIAELFVFELDSVPRKENGRFSCVGYILCSHRASSQAFRVLLGRLSKSSAKFLIRGRELPGSIQDRLSLARDGNFRKRVCFDVSSRDEFVSLRLQERGSEPYNISGSPFSVDWLIKAQGLELLFGKPDGSKRKRKDNDEGLPKKRQR